MHVKKDCWTSMRIKVEDMDRYRQDWIGEKSIGKYEWERRIEKIDKRMYQRKEKTR